MIKSWGSCTWLDTSQTWPRIFCLCDSLCPHLWFPPVSFIMHLRLGFLIWVTLEAFLYLTSMFPPLQWEVIHLGEFARMLYDFLRNVKLWIRMAASHCSLRGKEHIEVTRSPTWNISRFPSGTRKGTSGCRWQALKATGVSRCQSVQQQRNSRIWTPSASGFSRTGFTKAPNHRRGRL